MRSASSSVRRMASSSWSVARSAPARYSSAYPRMVARGVRSSCEASATNWRSRASDAVRWSKASSMRPSIPLSASPRSPASVPGVPSGTRADRSPAGDGRGSGRHAPQRPHPEANDPPGHQPQDAEHGGHRGSLHHHQAPDGLVDAVEGQGEDGQPTTASFQPSLHPVVHVGAVGGDGDGAAAAELLDVAGFEARHWGLAPARSGGHRGERPSGTDVPHVESAEAPSWPARPLRWTARGRPELGPRASQLGVDLGRQGRRGWCGRWLPPPPPAPRRSPPCPRGDELAATWPTAGPAACSPRPGWSG